MAFQPSPTDVSVIVTTPNTATGPEPRFLTERRVTPTWTVLQLKSKLETMTGIPTNCQSLLLKAPGRVDQWVDGDDSIIGNWGLMKGCEIEVCAVLSIFRFPNSTISSHVRSDSDGPGYSSFILDGRSVRYLTTTAQCYLPCLSFLRILIPASSRWMQHHGISLKWQ